MQTVLTILLGLAMAAVVAVLLTGVVGFARGGEFNRRHGHTLMKLRVATQGVALVLFVLLVLLR